MDLKSIVNKEISEKKQEKSLQIQEEQEELIQILTQKLEQQEKEMEQMRLRESEHSLILSEMKTEIQKKNSEIKSYREKIGTIYELDKKIEEVERQEEELRTMTLNVENEKKAFKWEKSRLKRKIEDLEESKYKYDELSDSLRTKEKGLNSLIDKQAKVIYQNEKKRLKMQIKAPLFIISFYAALITILKILDSKVLLSDISEFFTYIWNSILGFSNMIVGVFTYSIYDEGGVNEFAPVVISIFDIAIMVFKLGLVVLGVAIIIGIIKLTIKYYKENLSMYIILLDLVVVVFLGDRIKEVLDINLVSIFLFIYSVYLGIRFFKEK